MFVTCNIIAYSVKKANSNMSIFKTKLFIPKFKLNVKSSSLSSNNKLKNVTKKKYAIFLKK